MPGAGGRTAGRTPRQPHGAVPFADGRGAPRYLQQHGVPQAPADQAWHRVTSTANTSRRTASGASMTTGTVTR